MKPDPTSPEPDAPLAQARVLWPVEREQPGGDPDEHALLQESWTALGGLLESQAPLLAALDTAALAVGVRRQVRKQVWRRRTTRLAIAASLLVVGGLAWLAMSSQREDRPVVAGGVAPAGKATPKVVAAPEVKPSPIVAPVPAVAPPTTAVARELQWDDPLAEELASTVQQLTEVRESWLRPSDPISLVQEQLDALERDLQGASL